MYSVAEHSVFSGLYLDGRESSDDSYTGEMGDHTISFDPELAQKWPFAGRAAAYVLSFLLCASVVFSYFGLKLGAYVHSKNRELNTDQLPMNAEQMQKAFQRAVNQRNGEEGYISVRDVRKIGLEHNKPVTLNCKVEHGEDIGCFRPSMEDAQFVHENKQRLILGVFDGHGGRDVSAHAAKAFTEKVSGGATRFDTYIARAQGNVQIAFQEIVNDIHAEVISEGFTDGSTAVISYLDKQTNRLYTATLGDSEANIYRNVNGEMRSIPLSLVQNWTLDTELERLAAQSGMTKKQVLGIAVKAQQQYHKAHPGSELVSLDKILRCKYDPLRGRFAGINMARSIGDMQYACHMTREVEVTSVQLKPGDTLILACDGLKDYVPEKDIVAAVSSGKASPGQLIDLAKKNMVLRGHGDNVTVTSVKVT